MIASIAKFCIKCRYAKLYYTDYWDLFIAMLNVIMLSVVRLNVVPP
jgi:hypothetical protein